MNAGERPQRRARRRLLPCCRAGVLAALLGCGSADEPAATALASIALPSRPAPLDAGRPAGRALEGRASAAPSALDPSARDELRYRGLCHHGLGEADATLEHLVPVYRADPSDDRVALAIAEASLWKQDVKTAQGVVAALRVPEAPEALPVRGLLLEQSGQLDAAIALYERSIPRLEQPWSILERQAQALSWLRRFDAALATYARVAGDPAASPEQRLRCRVRMAEIAAWQRDLDGALAQLRSIASDAPERVDALLLQGQIQEWQGDFIGAKHSYSRILSADADQADARSRLGRLLWVE